MRISNTARWSLAALVAVVALMVALWPRGHDEPEQGPLSMSTEFGVPSGPPDVVRLPCALPSAAAGSGPLTGITLDCLGDGSRINLASALAGRPALLNLWAYWCAPCRDELPHIRAFADRAGMSMNVLTVHTDPTAGAALAMLGDIGVALPVVQDGDAAVRTAVGAPAVLPISVLVRADGSIAKVLVQPFTSVDDIVDAVRNNLGISV